MIALIELIGAILFLIPPATRTGARVLLTVFVSAAVVHILHGQSDIELLVIYALAVLAVSTGKE